MEKVLNKTFNVLARVGEQIERHLTIDDKDESYHDRSRSSFKHANGEPGYHRPLDKKNHKNMIYSKSRNLSHGDARQYSSDHLAASPGPSSFNNYRQNPGRRRANDGDGPPYGTGIGAPLNYGNFSGGFANSAQFMPYGSGQGNVGYGSIPGNVGYAPDYYIAERRQIELVPAPQPRIIQQQVPVPYPVDRPVPQPYPVGVPVPYAVDRPVPVAVPTPVQVDRPVPYPVPVAVQSQPAYVSVPVPTPVPCYVPVAVPVPSPPPPLTPVIYEQSVTHKQRWINGTPQVMNQQRYLAGSPAMGMNLNGSFGNGSFVR